MNQDRVSPRDEDLAPLQGETDKAYGERMAAKAKQSRDQAHSVISSTDARVAEAFWQRNVAVGICLLVAFLGLAGVIGIYYAYKGGDGVVGDIRLLSQDHKAIAGKLDNGFKLLGEKIDKIPAASASMCPAAGNVTITLDEYNKLNARPKSCAAASTRSVHRPRRDTVITESRVPPKTSFSTTGGSVDHCIFRIQGKILATTSVPQGQGKDACPVWRDEMVRKYHANPNDVIWSKQYPNDHPQ